MVSIYQGKFAGQFVGNRLPLAGFRIKLRSSHAHIFLPLARSAYCLLVLSLDYPPELIASLLVDKEIQ